MSFTFSIITATYNSEKTLERTIKSLLNQSFKNFEYLIIDGNSSDSTLSIVKKYEKEFTDKDISFKYISEPDKGIYDAWNKGLLLASGEWISFLGSDDYYIENALEIYHSNINTNFNYLHSKVRLVDENDKQLKILGTPIIKKQFHQYMKIAHVGSFHHKSLFQNEKFSLKYKSASDYFFFLKNLELINSFYINEITAVMQHGGISTNVNSALKEALRVKIEVNKRNSILCYIDFFIAHLKHFVGRNIRSI
ncbi:glycosyltransferase family 2 protein [Flavobacterium sp. N2270]|uniref:glycosyltransferase family 2 protein n=1 Tax=Flavobacterium sp. N2270 TaxID=2986831 RepID=UPI002223F3EA|nr:glycosyltransferase family 2 protein [Flavobacterium sp. N2270]